MNMSLHSAAIPDTPCQSTAFYTALTSLPPTPSQKTTTVPLRQETTSTPVEILYDETKAYDDEDLIRFDSLAHQPPFLPTTPRYTRNSTSLRQSVISRQSTRLYPCEDPLREHMEEQLVRWGAPQSSFRVDDILSGKHTFQKNDIPVLEPVVDNGAASRVEMVCSTDSSVMSISRSPYVAREIMSLRSVGTDVERDIFKELIADDVEYSLSKSYQQQMHSLGREEIESIQDSAYFNTTGVSDQIETSPSIRSTYLQETGDSENVSHRDGTTATPIAYPLTERDIPQLFKVSENPQAVLSNEELDGQHHLQMNPSRLRQGFSQQPEEEELSCWNITGGVFCEMWKDFVSVATCTILPDESQTEMHFR